MAQGGFPSSVAVRNPGLMSVVYFTSSGTFNKADYPGAQSVRVRVQGGGGAGGGPQATGAGEGSTGSGGGGGAYAESLIDVGALSSSETVTVGAGGTGVVGDAGGAGGSSSFGSHVSAGGGLGGSRTSTSSASDAAGLRGGPGGTASAGDIQMSGSSGGTAHRGPFPVGSEGGPSALGGGGVPPSGVSASGVSGGDFGGGGSGGHNRASESAKAGGNGAPGIVIVEVYSTYKGGDTDQFATRQYVDGGEWSALTLQNGWGDVSGGASRTARFKIERDRVYVEGLIAGGTTTNSTVIFTLPVGARPPQDILVPIMDNTVARRLSIRQNGEAQIYGVTSNTYVGFQFSFGLTS